jgi:hypothetical protein
MVIGYGDQHWIFLLRCFWRKIQELGDTVYRHIFLLSTETHWFQAHMVKGRLHCKISSCLDPESSEQTYKYGC